MDRVSVLIGTDFETVRKLRFCGYPKRGMKSLPQSHPINGQWIIRYYSSTRTYAVKKRLKETFFNRGMKSSGWSFGRFVYPRLTMHNAHYVNPV